MRANRSPFRVFCCLLPVATASAFGQETTTITLPGDVPLVMIRVPAGSFLMGSSGTERSRNSNERPVHMVTIAYDFYMGKYELTQQQWKGLVSSWPMHWNSAMGLGDRYGTAELPPVATPMVCFKTKANTSADRSLQRNKPRLAGRCISVLSPSQAPFGA